MRAHRIIKPAMVGWLVFGILTAATVDTMLGYYITAPVAGFWGGYGLYRLTNRR